jgi:sugar-specific transcriptional regulator TrmB
MAKSSIFQEIGLSRWESQTYLALLEIGSTTTGPLVIKSEVPQSKIYSVLDSLIKKGLVSYIVRGKIKFFQATDPKRILTLFKEREKEIERVIKDIPVHKTSSVELFEGLKAMRASWVSIVDQAQKGEPIYGYSAGNYPAEIVDFWAFCHSRSEVAGLKDHLLITKKIKEKFISSIKGDQEKNMNRVTRLSEVSFPGDVGIFRNQVFIYNWSNPYKLIVITDDNLAKEYKDFFLNLWEKAQKI